MTTTTPSAGPEPNVHSGSIIVNTTFTTHQVIIPNAEISDHKRSPHLDSLLSTLLPTTAATSVATLFQPFSSCHNLDDHITVSLQLIRPTSSTDLAGSSLIENGQGIDSDLISLHVAAITNRGIRSVLTSLSNSIKPRTLQTLPGDCKQLQSLASDGGLLLLPDSFSPNLGQGVSAYPTDIAPPNAIAAHLGMKQRSGEVLILPTEFARKACADSGLQFHVSNPFIQPKPGTAIGRLVCDYTNCIGSGLNSDSKKERLRELWGPMDLPLMADVSQLLLNCRSRYPHPTLIYGQRMDIDKAHNRIRPQPHLCPLLSLHIDINNLPHVGIPVVNMFGLQDSNFVFEFGSLPLHNKVASRLHSNHNANLSNKYVDDFFEFIPASDTENEREHFTIDATARFGEGAVAEKKTLFGDAIEIIGWIWDTNTMSAIISVRMFSKLIIRFFVDLPDDIMSRDSIPTDILHSLAGTVVRCANAMLPLLPYSRGFHNNLRNVAENAPTTRLSRRSKFDIIMWRAALQVSLLDTRWLTVPVSHCVLHRRLPNEALDPLDHIRAARQAAAADYIIWGDACLSVHGLGGYSPNIAWFSLSFPELEFYMGPADTFIHTDINVFEFIAALLSVTMAIHYLSHNRYTSTRAHIHVWTDNTSCRSWIQTHRSDHPLHSFLLQMFSLLQIKYAVTVTSGHTYGESNLHADCNSRLFQCPNADIVIAEQRHLPQYHPSRQLLSAILRISKLPSADTWNSAPEVLMLLDTVLGHASVSSTTSTANSRIPQT